MTVLDRTVRFVARAVGATHFSLAGQQVMGRRYHETRRGAGDGDTLIHTPYMGPTIYVANALVIDAMGLPF